MQGIGLALVYITVPIVIVSAAPPDRTSEATGMLSVTRATAMGIGAQLIATILAAPMTHGANIDHRFPSAQGFRTVSLFIAGTAIVALVAALLLPTGNPLRGKAPSTHPAQ